MKFEKAAEDLIAELRGIAPSRGYGRKREPIKLNNVLESILQQHQIGRVSMEDTLVHHWRDIVGEQTAHRCRPQKILADKRLIIVASNPVIRQELVFKKRRILKFIKTLPDCDVIKDILIQCG